MWVADGADERLGRPASRVPRHEQSDAPVDCRCARAAHSPHPVGPGPGRSPRPGRRGPGRSPRPEGRGVLAAPADERRPRCRARTSSGSVPGSCRRLATEVRIADRPVRDDRPAHVRRERRERREDRERRRAEVLDQAGQPRRTAAAAADVRDQGAATARLRVRPQQPHELRGEDERRRVVGEEGAPRHAA